MSVRSGSFIVLTIGSPTVGSTGSSPILRSYTRAMTLSAACRMAGSAAPSAPTSSGPLTRSNSRRAAPSAPADNAPNAYSDSPATRGVSSRTAVRSAASTASGTGLDPIASRPEANAVSAVVPARDVMAALSARKMFNSAAIASSCTVLLGSSTSFASGSAASG